MKHRYLIALGSNRPHARYGSPRRVLQAALAALGGKLEAVSPIITSAPLGPSRRRYANAAAVVRSKREPDRMLARLKALELKFGRRSSGQRWGPRVLDLDIIMWEGGMWSSPGLTVPHISFRSRRFSCSSAAMRDIVRSSVGIATTITLGPHGSGREVEVFGPNWEPS